MIQCCETAIGNLTEEKVSLELGDLRTNRLIEMNTDPKGDLYTITTSGIIHVRKNLLKPISDYAENHDFGTISGGEVDDQILKKAQTLKESSTQSDGHLNKQEFTIRITELAVNGIGPFMNLLTKISNFMNSV